MRPSSPFRTAAVACSVVVASIGFGLIAPTVAVADTDSTPRANTAANTASLDDMPIDERIAAPRITGITSTPWGSSVVQGIAGTDEVWLLSDGVVVDRWPGGGLFQVWAQDRHKDSKMELVLVRTKDGTKTRSTPFDLPRTLQVSGLADQNTFVPGTQQFSGTATAGATIRAVDTTTNETLFSTEVSGGARSATGAQSATGTWSAETSFDAGSEYRVLFVQVLPGGQTTRIDPVRFTAAAADAPAAPTVRETLRTPKGDFRIEGTVDAATISVVAKDSTGAPIATATIHKGEYSVIVPGRLVGQTVSVEARSASDAVSPRASVTLSPLPTDDSVTVPGIRAVEVLPNGSIMVIGGQERTLGTWVMDGDHVIASYDNVGAYSFRIDKEYTGKQLDVVALGSDGQKITGMSERVALPRLLQVDGIEEENSYTPGTRTFTGRAEAGATITATDQDGKKVFETTAASTRSGVAAWSAEADLSSPLGYTLTFTQTTADGRTSVMKHVPFDADQSARDLTITSHERGGTFVVGPQVFTGMATPGATVTLNPFGFDARYASYDITTRADVDGKWEIRRGLGDSSYRELGVKQDVYGDVVREITRLDLRPAGAVGAAADLVITGPGTTFTGGTVQTFRGTATPGTLVHLMPFGEDERYAQYRLTTTADATTGAWEITRSLANQVYPVVITQDGGAGKVQRVAHTMTPAG